MISWNNRHDARAIINTNTKRYASSSSSSYQAFDMKMKLLQRDNAARASTKYHNPQRYDYFYQEISNRLIDRLDDIQRYDGFPLALDIHSGPGYIYRSICYDDFIQQQEDEEGEANTTDATGGMGGVKKLVQMDYSTLLLHRDVNIPIEGSHRCHTYRFHVNYQDDDNQNIALPFPDESFDLVISNCSLHYMNDLPNVLKDVYRILKPDGCFLWSMIGNVDTTLYELSTAFHMAEMEREGGVGTHVGPFIPIQTVGSLLQQSKFTLPTIDVDTITLSYPNAFVLMEHLQRMGENNSNQQQQQQRRHYVSKDTFLAMACVYDHLFSVNDDQNHDNDSEIIATIQVIYAIGWKEHSSQPQPLQRGTAQLRIKDAIITK